MPKPTSLPEWASDGTLIVEPAAGLKATGWSNATRPPAKYQNWYQELVYRWCEYLDSGALEGNHSVDGNLSTISGGTMTAAGLLTASAGITTTMITASGLITANAGVSTTTLLASSTVTASGGSADAYARLSTVSNAGKLELTEDSADFTFSLKLQAGWNSVATANRAVDIPLEAGLPSNGELNVGLAPATWTPVVTGITGQSYTQQTGLVQRIGHMVHATFALAWTGGSVSTGLLGITGLPYAKASAVRSLSLYSGDSIAGHAYGSSTAAYCALMMASGSSNLLGYATSDGGTTLGARQPVGAAGGLTGVLTYWVS